MLFFSAFLKKQLLRMSHDTVLSLPGVRCSSAWGKVRAQALGIQTILLWSRHPDCELPPP